MIEPLFLNTQQEQLIHECKQHQYKGGECENCPYEPQCTHFVQLTSVAPIQCYFSAHFNNYVADIEER